MTETAMLPAENTVWRARDGRRMSLQYWIPDRAKPTAFMAVLNPGYRMRRYSEQAADSFGSFLQPEVSP
jgi:hypothetical protein